MSQPIDQPHHGGVLAEHLRDVQANEQRSFHMPGHKGGLGAPPLAVELLGDAAFAVDVSEIGGFDYLHGATSALIVAQQQAAQVFGADKTWFLVNGATVGNIAAISATVSDGEKILVARDSHRSVYAGIAVSGAQPIYLSPVRNNTLDGLYGIDVDELAHVLEQYPEIGVVHLTNPSFYGFTIALREIVDVVHNHDALLIVDEAHGTHFIFHDAFPESALSCGADLVVQSPHKTLGSLTQSSLLHAQGPRVPTVKIQALLAMLQSSSPSALLQISLDAAIAEMAECGNKRWGYALDLAREIRERATELDRIRIYQDETDGSAGIASHDPTKIVVDVQGLATTGFAAARWLRSEWNINPEFSDLRRMVFSITIGDDDKQPELLISALQELETHSHEFEEHPSVNSLWPSQMPRSQLTPRLAHQCPHVAIDSSLAVGRVAGEMIIPYPPGVPLLVAGEEITVEILSSMRQLIDAGCHIVGLSDPTGTTLQVLPDS